MKQWFRALWLVVRTAFVASPWRAAIVFTVLPLASLTLVLSGWWLKMLADGIVYRDPDRAAMAVLAVAGSLAFQHVMVVVLSKVRFNLQERTSLRFEGSCCPWWQACPASSTTSGPTTSTASRCCGPSGPSSPRRWERWS